MRMRGRGANKPSALGFTLIELLVVIAIIAILAAILFPVFAKARAKAEQTDCVSNEKQIAFAVIMYSGDYDQHFPLVNAGNQYYWPIGLYSYTKETQIFLCKAFTDDQSWTTADPVPACAASTGISYGFNDWLGTVNPNTQTAFGSAQEATAKINRVNQPSQTIMIFDEKEGSTPFDPWGPDIATGAAVGTNPTGASGIFTRANHSGDDKGPSMVDTGMCDIAYVDGHVKAMPANYPTDTSPTSDWVPRR